MFHVFRIDRLRARGRIAGCRGGFRGRVGIFELFEINDQMRQMIMERQDGGSIRAAAAAAGMRTMFGDGLAKVFLGETTLAEVYRVAM